MASKGISGWESLGVNNPTKYKATFDYNNGTIAPSGQQGKDKIVVITDRSSGSYDVYKQTFFGDKLIYQSNASTNKPKIVNQADYNRFFAGKNTQQLTNLTGGVKQATLNLAKENLSGSTSRKEFQELQQTPGYKSLSNTEEPPLPPAVVDTDDNNRIPLSGGEEEGGGRSDADNGTLTGSFDSFLAPDGFPSFSDLSSTNFASLGDDAFLGTIDDALPFEAGINIDLGITNNTEPDSPSTVQPKKVVETLRYPEADLTGFGFDYIQIIGHEYTTNKAGNFSSFGKKDGSVKPTINDFKDQTGVASKLGDTTKIIHLPMQPNLSESNSVDWFQDEINEIQRRAAGLAAQGITDIRNSKSVKDGGQSIVNLLSSGGDTVKKLLKDPDLGPFITAYFAGQAVGANIVGRSTGQVLNKNLELLFKGPKLRQFSFNFTFTPRSDTEAIVVKNIIRFFKRSMSPSVSSERIFLNTPDIFEIKYIHNSGGDHPFLNRFKPCALTNFSANYTPGNSYMTYKDGSMTQYQIAMTFSELEPIYQHEHDGVGGTGY